MTYVCIIIIQSVWFSLPMYAGNLFPVVAKRIPVLDIPIDGGVMWKGKPVFGSHKTVRGFIAGTLSAVIIVYAQKLLFLQGGIWESVSIVDYSAISIVLFGSLMGFGALTGDAVESFFKRRVGISPGRPWLVFDQIDYVIGALVFASVVFVPSVVHIVTILFLGVAGSFVGSYLGYHTGFKESKV